MQRLSNAQLFAVCVLTWGTTWYAISFQIGHTPPEVGVALAVHAEQPRAARAAGRAVPMTFEHFHPDALTFAGAALAALGNVLMLRRA